MTPQPFFVYLRAGAVHAPHHVPKSGRQDKGHTTRAGTPVRAETLERQKKLGVIPQTPTGRQTQGLQGVGLAPEAERRLFARQAEVFSGFLEQTDSEIGRFEQRSRRSA